MTYKTHHVSEGDGLIAPSLREELTKLLKSLEAEGREPVTISYCNPGDQTAYHYFLVVSREVAPVPEAKPIRVVFRRKIKGANNDYLRYVGVQAEGGEMIPDAKLPWAADGDYEALDLTVAGTFGADKPLSPEEWETIRALRSGKANVRLS